MHYLLVVRADFLIERQLQEFSLKMILHRDKSIRFVKYFIFACSNKIKIKMLNFEINFSRFELMPPPSECLISLIQTILPIFFFNFIIVSLPPIKVLTICIKHNQMMQMMKVNQSKCHH